MAAQSAWRGGRCKLRTSEVIKLGVIKEIVFDCGNAPRLARFWAALLDGYEVRPYDAAELARLAVLGLTADTDPTVMVDGPGPSLCFQQAEGASAPRSRLHLDISAPDRETAVGLCLAKGAELVRTAPSYTVLADPEGNRFCIVSIG